MIESLLTGLLDRAETLKKETIADAESYNTRLREEIEKLVLEVESIMQQLPPIESNYIDIAGPLSNNSARNYDPIKRWKGLGQDQTSSAVTWWVSWPEGQGDYDEKGPMTLDTALEEVVYKEARYRVRYDNSEQALTLRVEPIPGEAKGE